nr:reverse transcriptase domain-containing protein [Streptomyces sp. NBC_00886]
MHVQPKIMQKLDLSGAANYCLSTPMDRLPLLITDRCLTDAKETIVKWTNAHFSGGVHIPKEIITMPKSRFGQRPVILSSLPSRILYHALVAGIASTLEADSRGGEAWVQHEAFAEESPSEYIVQVDIAACYEFIDHERLRQELVTRILDADYAKTITDYLEECSTNRRGLPQLTAASDKLADLYLSIIQRQLMRQGLEVSRYADDFIIRVGSWERANETIEYAAEYARNLGLILSYEKTRAARTLFYKKKAESQRELQKRYFDSEKERMTFFHVAGGGRYGDVSLGEVLPSDVEALKSSMWRVVFDWQNKSGDARANPDIEVHSESSLRQLLPLAISVLQDEHKRIANSVLTNLVTTEPIRLERVCRYALGRIARPAEAEDNWKLIQALTGSGRLSPWGRIWLLYVISELPPVEVPSFDQTQRWVQRQLSDRHETVRVQAAWAAATFKQLKDDQVYELFRSATPITLPGIAAAMGKKAGVLKAENRQGGLSKALISSAISESTLNKAAYEWGEKV